MQRWLLVILALPALAAPTFHAQFTEHPAGMSASISRAQPGPLRDDANRGPTAQEQPQKEKEGQPQPLPLKPERKIQFTTTEGSWLSLDVSPDGSTIIFDLLGDLYSLPFSGGEAKRLTGGLPFDSQPRFSPDGTLIAYVSDATGSEQVWTMKADGSERKPISKGPRLLFASPTWTPDGQYVLASRANEQTRFDYELWLYHKDGGTGVRLIKVKTSDTPGAEQWSVSVLGAIVSRDGRYVYYAAKTRDALYNVEYPIWQLACLDRETGDKNVLTNVPGSAVRPVLSPDGKWIVYGTRFDTETGLRLRDVDTGDERWLAYPVQHDEQEGRPTRDLLPGYTFTPDGKSIVLNYGGKIHKIDVETGRDDVIPFTANVDLDLGPKLAFETAVEQGPVKARLIDGASQSPDGRRLAFSALSHLYVMDLPSGRPRRLTGSADGEFMPAWSPDGRWITYVTWTGNGGYLWKIPPEGGEPKRLTSRSGYYTTPEFAPDGTKIVVVVAPPRVRLEHEGGQRLWAPSTNLYWVSAEGGTLTYIASAQGMSRPHFAKDAARFYVTTDKGLVSMRLDGTDRRTVVKVVGGSGMLSKDYPMGVLASDIRLAPDGSRALAEVKSQVYLVQVPLVGSEALTVDVEAPSVPVRKLTEVGGADVNWADGGKTPTWSLGATFFRQPDRASTPERVAVDIQMPRAVPTGTVVLRGATVITMKGDEVLVNADLVITGNRITAVGARGKVSVPIGAKIVQVGGKTIVPGFVDTHSHVTVGTGLRGVRDVVAWTYLAQLAYGVTTMRDPETGTRDAFAYQDLVDAGAMLGPRAYSTGPAIFSNSNFKTVAEARNVVRRYTEYYRTNLIKAYEVGDRNQRQFLVMACKELGAIPTTEGSIDLKLEMTHAMDGFSGNEHALPVVPLYQDVIQLFARSGISYTPTLLVNYGGPFAENYFFERYDVHGDPKLRRFIPHGWLDLHTKRRPWFAEDEYIFRRTAKVAAEIARAGGKVAIGSHGELQGLGYHWEMWALAAGGMTPHEVLRSATIVGAEAIGMRKDLGSVEPGKLADLIVLDKDPLQEIHNTNSIHYVMKNGELFDGNTLDEIWPVSKKLPPLYWGGTDPKAVAPEDSSMPTRGRTEPRLAPRR